MKKIFSMIIILVLLSTLCACGNESDAEKAYKEAQEQVNQLEKQYTDAQNKADNFKNDVKDYYSYLN